MRKTYGILIIVFFFLSFETAFSQVQRYWISTTSSNWNNAANWSTASGGAGGASVPTSTNIAIFNGAGGRNGNCIIDVAPTVDGITLNGYSGIIDLQGFNITTTGVNTLTSATISNSGASASLVLNTTGITLFNGTTFNADITGTSGRIFFSGSVFNGTVNVTKSSGAASDNGTGGNIFNNTVTLINASTATLQLAGTNPDTFQGTLTLNVNNTGDISLARIATGNQFNGDVIIYYNSTGGVLFGANNGTSTLASSKTISVANYGASGCGDLSLGRFTQVGTTTQTLNLAGNNNALLSIGPNSTFNASLTVSTPNINLQTSTFNGITQLTKTGTSTSNLRGGNLFANTTTIINQGGDLVFGHTTTDPGDTFNGTTVVNNLGGYRIRISEQTSGTVFNGTATFNCLGVTDVQNRIQISRLAGGQTTFNGAAYFVNNGNASDIQISYDAGTSTTFNGPVSFTSSALGGGDFYVGNDGDVIFNNNIEFNSTCSDIIYVTLGSGTATFGNGSMTIGASGFAQGQIRLSSFSQTGSAAQSLTLTGTAALYLGPSSQFNGNVNFVTPQIYLNGCTFNGTTYIEKSGAASNIGSGSNNFNGITTLVNSGSGNFISGNSSVDNFNNDLTLTNSNTGLISMADNSAGNIFRGNITVNSTAGGGIYFGNNTNASASLATGKTIAIGASGFNSGELRLRRFTQLGTTAQNITLSGSTAILTLGPSSQFGGNVNFIAPQVYLNGTTFSGTAYIEKNGATDNTGTGGDTFNGATTLVNSGSGTLDLASTSPDIFNSTLTINNTGTYRVQIGISSVGNTFNGNVTINHGGNNTSSTNTIIARNAGSTATFNGNLTLNCTNLGGTGTGIVIANDGSATINGNVTVSTTNGRGVLFGAGIGSATLANGFTIKDAGAGTFTTGTLTLKGFTQTGTTAQVITLTGTADLTLGSASTFNGAVTFVTPQIFLNGCTFNGTTFIQKTGANTNAGAGSNIFNGITTLVNSGSGIFESGNTSFDRFNNDLTLNNIGSANISMADNSSGNVFNGNITVNSTSGNGIYFGDNGSASASLASGKTITVGGLGFTAGELRLKRFTQIGSTLQTLTLTNAGVLRLGPSSQFSGVVNFTSPRVFLDGCTFNTTTTIQKNGTGTDDCAGNNVFNGTTTLTSNSTSRLRLANTTADNFNGAVTFVRGGTGAFDVGYTGINNFGGDITLNSTAGITFGANGGTVQFNNGNTQSINKVSGSASPIFPRLIIAKTLNTVVNLNTDVSITSAATFTTGIINTTSTNYINFANDATVASANDASYVNGPVRKTGDDAFTFPVGGDGFYRPISISAPSNTAHHFTAQYFKGAQTFGGPSTYDPSFTALNTCDYWILDRTNGTSNVTVRLSWNQSACSGPNFVSNLPDLRVARFNSGTSKWVNEGNGGAVGTTASGTVVSGAAVTTFSPFTLASVDLLNPLPIELGAFWAKDLNGIVQLNWITYSEENNDYFTVERSQTGLDFQSINKTKGAGTSAEKITYQSVDESPLGGLSYYRLKQTDFDGKETYSKIISVQRKGEGLVFALYPNPAGDELVKFNQKANITITNSVGQLITTAQGVEGMDASILKSGVYIIKNQKGEVVRLIKK